MTQIDLQIIAEATAAANKLTRALQQVSGPVVTGSGTVLKGSGKKANYINRTQVRRIIENKFNKKYGTV